MLNWLNTFQLPSQGSSWEDFADGVSLSYVFHSIAPDSFAIVDHVGDNTLLMYANLRRLLQETKEFMISDVGMNCDVVNFEGGMSVDHAVLVDDVILLARLALVAAVRCEDNARFVSTIMRFGQVEQQSLMLAVQEVESHMTHVGGDDSQADIHTYNRGALNESSFSASKAVLAYNEKALEELMEERSRLLKELDDLKVHVANLELAQAEWMAEKRNLHHELALQSPADKAVMHRMKEEKYQMDQDLRDQVDELQFALAQRDLEIAKLQKTLNDQTDRLNRAEDELDVLQEESKELTQMRRKVQFLELKAKEQDEVVSRTTVLLEECEGYKIKIQELVEENQRSQKALETSRTKLRAMEVKQLDLQDELVTKEATMKKTQEAKAELEKQVRTLTAEIEQRSSESPVLRHASAFGAGESLAHLDIGATSDQQEVRDLWVQLDHRTSQVADLEDKVAIMEERSREKATLIADLNARIEQLQQATQPNLLIQKQLTQLESENAKLKAAYEEARSANKREMSTKVKALQEDHALQDQLVLLRKQLDESARRLADLQRAKDDERRLLMSHFYAIARASVTGSSKPSPIAVGGTLPTSPLGTARYAPK